MHWIDLEDEDDKPGEDEVVEWGYEELVGDWPDSLHTITPIARAPLKYKPYNVTHFRRLDLDNPVESW